MLELPQGMNVSSGDLPSPPEKKCKKKSKNQKDGPLVSFSKLKGIPSLEDTEQVLPAVHPSSPAGPHED